MARRKRPLLALAVGTVVALVLLEVGLQAVALVTGAKGRAVAVDGRPAIVCVGDSNTYGIFLAAEDSYPGQLQAFLGAGGDDHVVVNRGYPGQNTAQVSTGLEETLRDLEPSAVVVFCGVNDRWSDASRPAWGGAQPGALSRLLAKSRVVKLANLIRAAESSGDATAVIAADGRVSRKHDSEAPKVDGFRPSKVARESIQGNLGRIAELSRARGAEVVFVGYPLFSRGIREDVNGSIRAAAEACGARYVDLATRFDELVRAVGQDQLYVPRDSHLSAVGNHEAARQVLSALVDAGVVDVPVPPPLEEAYGGLTLALERAGDEITAQLAGPPSWTWRLYLSRRTPVSGTKFSPRFPPSALGIEGQAARSWQGSFDAEGRATTRVSLPAAKETDSSIDWALSVTALPETGGPREVQFSAVAEVPE